MSRTATSAFWLANPVANQMLVMDQFDQMPIILFTTRYNEIMGNGGNRWVSITQSMSKRTGKMVFIVTETTYTNQDGQVLAKIRCTG